MLTKGNLILFLIGLGIFIICFVLLMIIGSLSLPKSQGEKMEEAKLILPSGEMVPMPLLATGGDSVRIKNDLVFFWPLVFTESYDEVEGSYFWLYGSSPPAQHPLVLLYWAFVSVIISLVVLLVMRKFFKKR